jgi:sigma-B regulation protein RsbU (phosphoserine phosphatase)
MCSRTCSRGAVELGGHHVDLRGASAAAFTRELKAALRADGQAEIEWERGGEQAVDVYRSFVSAFAWLAGLPLSIASALAAVMLLLRAPDWPLSGLGFVFFAGLTLFAVDPGITPMPIGVPETAQLIVRPTLGAVAILIAVRFPDSPRPAKRWDLALAVLVAAAVLGLYLVLSYGPFRGFVYGAAALLVVFGATVSALALRTYRRTDPVRRRQIRWVLYGAFVALAMLVFGNLAFLIDPPLLFLAGLPMGLGFTALPVGFLIAVFGYRFLDADPLISSATSYFLLGLAVLVVIETLIPRVADAVGGVLRVAPDRAELALAIAVVFLAIPVHRLIRPRIESFFFPERPAFEDGIHELLDGASDIEEPDRMVEYVGSRLADLLNVRRCAVFALEASGYEARYRVGIDESPILPEESALVATLSERSAPLTDDRFARSDRIQQLPRDERALLARLGITLVIPIRSRGRLLGWIGLGAKRSGDIYTSTELGLLTAVANVVATRLRHA